MITTSRQSDKTMVTLKAKYNLADFVNAKNMCVLGHKECGGDAGSVMTRYYLYKNGDLAQVNVIKSKSMPPRARLSLYDSYARQVAFYKDMKCGVNALRDLEKLCATQTGPLVDYDMLWEVYHDIGELTVKDVMWHAAGTYYYLGGVEGHRIRSLEVGPEDMSLHNHVVMRDTSGRTIVRYLWREEVPILRALMRRVINSR